MGPFSAKGKKRIGILRGGPSHEYERSLRSGAEVISHLPSSYDPVDIFISREGEWHIGGLARSPERILPHVDAVWNALHGTYGEDGKVQHILESFHVPFTGSRRLGSAFGMNKNLSKALFLYHGLKTPHHEVMYPQDYRSKTLAELFRSFPQPSVVKPVSGSGTLAVCQVGDFNTFCVAVESAFHHGESVLIEEKITGMEISCAVIEGSDGRTVFALPPVFPAHAEASGHAEHVAPAPISGEEARKIQDLAITVHRKLGFRHYSVVDFMIHPTRGIFVIEANSLPDLSSGSVFRTALSAAQIDLADFVDHSLTLALSSLSSR